MPKCSSVDCRKYSPSIPGCNDKTCMYDEATKLRLPNEVLMKYCSICKRYFPVKVYDKHMAKHNIPTNLAAGDKNESGK